MYKNHIRVLRRGSCGSASCVSLNPGITFCGTKHSSSDFIPGMHAAAHVGALDAKRRLLANDCKTSDHLSQPCLTMCPKHPRTSCSDT